MSTSTDYRNLPLRDLPAGRLHDRKVHLLAEIGRERPRLSFGRRASFRARGAILAFAVGLAVIGSAAAATSWLTGSPAPPVVVSDFESYAPQLGFRPNSGGAVLVAADSGALLYATTNDRGSYCLLASTSWKRPGALGDGGSCVAPAHASAPLVAGVLGLSSPQSTVVVAGRTTDPEARQARFAGPDGRTLVRPIGASGFFVASVDAPGSPCANGDWAPELTVLGADGAELSRETVVLADARPGGVCVLAAPHA